MIYYVFTAYCGGENLGIVYCDISNGDIHTIVSGCHYINGLYANEVIPNYLAEIVYILNPICFDVEEDYYDNRKNIAENIILELIFDKL